MRPLAARLLVSFVALLSTTLLAQNMPPVPRIAGLPPAAEQAMAAVNPENIRAQVRFLASDCWKAAAPASAEATSPPNTSPRNSRCTD